MTERLTALLAREVEALDVPPPPASAVLTRAHGLRRRRHATRGIAAAVALAVVGTSAALLSGGDPSTAGIDPAAPSPVVDVGIAFSVGSEVYVDGGERSVTIDDPAVKSFFYTSAGLVVRHGDNPSSDGGGPQRFSLVTAEGDRGPLALETEGVWHSADPSQPYLGYAEEVDGVVTAVVLDVRSQEEVVEVALPEHSGAFTPTSLSGGTLYVGDPEAERAFEVDVATGEVVATTGADAVWDVRGGHTVTDGPGGTTVVDVETGEVLLEVPTSPDAFTYVNLSPDGRYAQVVGEDPDTFEPLPPVVYDVAAGRSVDLPADRSDDMSGYGWSNDSEDLFGVLASGEVLSCAAASGECTTTDPGLAAAPEQLLGGDEDFSRYLVVGGRVRES